nr:1-phosphatidylinositol 4,5-bisphosphate phosphodiesterase eta-2 [Paramormyrops kingsleyae]
MSAKKPDPSLAAKDSTESQDSHSVAVSLFHAFFLSANFIGVVEKCMNSMQTGTQMVKLRGGSKGLLRYFYLDEHKSCIRWRPSRKNEKAKISIDSIREVCEGKQSEIFQRYADGSFDPNCCFSIYYGEHMESLDLVSTNGEEARTWITGLKYLVAGISDEDSLAKRQRTRDQWLKQTFSEADKNGDGSLSISEVLQLLHKLNVNLPRQKVKQMFKEADTDENQGTLGFEEFCTFYKMMSTRRDLYLLMLTYSNHKDHMDTGDLARFLEIEQKMTSVTKEHCLEIVNKFEPCPENQAQGVLGIDGFTNYMRSPAGDIFNPEHNEVNQDMTRPLCNYFIASSHNTYLMGDQLMSQSRVDMYSWVLQSGCRCVEVDCWDGQDGDPIVHHGYTLTSKILFKDVVETINKYAFVKNPYPVILSIENHCSVPQQKKMAQYLMEVLGDKLDLSDVSLDESGRLPSPESLKEKILIKGKKLPANIDEDAEEGDVSDEDSADEMEDDCKLMNGDMSVNRKQVESLAKKKLDTLMKESKIRDREDPDNFTITSLPAEKISQKGSPKVKGDEGTDTADESTPNTNKRVGRSFMGSFSKRKKKAAKLKKTSSLEDTDTDQESSSSASRAPGHHSRKKKTMKLSRALSDLVKYTQSVGMHDIETQGERPTCSEKQGAQSDTGRHLGEWRTTCMRRDMIPLIPQKGIVLEAVLLWSHMAGRPRHQGHVPVSGDNRASVTQIIDPFVEVEIIGLPVDCSKEQTRVVDDNGFNPMWEETLVFTLHMPEIALVRFLVWDHDPIGQDFIGQRTIAFTSMMSGYRHVYLEGMEEASIFVHVAVNDITGKVRPVSGIKGLFHRNPKQSSLDSHAAAQLSRKSAFGAHLLRRTASEPTKGQAKAKKGFPEISINTKDCSSEGTSEDRDAEDGSRPRCDRERDSPAAGLRDCTNGEAPPGGSKDNPEMQRSSIPLQPLETIAEESEERHTRHSTSISSPASTLSLSSIPVSFPSAAASFRATAGRAADEVGRRHPMERTFSLHAEPASAQSSIGRAQGTKTVNGDCEDPTFTSIDSPCHLDHACQHKGNCERSTSTGQGDYVSLTSEEVDQTLTVECSPGHPGARAPAKRALFSNGPTLGSKGGQSCPIRRAKSEGHVKSEHWEAVSSPVPEVCTDATMNDRLWSKLDLGAHRDSVSSSSSISSSDTVIDLSLPNLARKGLASLGGAEDEHEEVFTVSRADCLPSAARTGYSTLLVSKSKSNPNLRADDPSEIEDELQPRPLGREPGASGRLMQRRHTWSRLYMEGLKQSSALAKKASTPAPSEKDMDSSSKSKSLGDLTSDDIACNFDSKYRSISRSFVVRSTRSPRKPIGKAGNELEEQLRKLTDVEPLTASDFTQPLDQGAEVPPLRRMSSRSQSRVRYIANRAKQAQERQRLQELAQQGGSPIEERGNPEGACTVARSPCIGLDLLSQLPLMPPGQGPQEMDPEVVFMLKL